MREPEPPPKPLTQARSVQTDPWKPPAPPASSTPQKEVLVMKKPTVITLEPENETQSAMAKLEEKYEEIIREKDEQIQDLLQEV